MKNQLNPQCVHTWANSIGYASVYKMRNRWEIPRLEN